MDPLQKRFALFLLGCVPLRLALAYMIGSEVIPSRWLRVVAILAAIIATGFFVIFVGGFRRTGLETGGAPIWWNALRPIHAMLYGLVAYYAWLGNRSVVWKLLLADVCIGLFSFLLHHGRNKNIQKMLKTI